MEIRDLGEQGLLAMVKRFCPLEVVGDDAAVLSPLADQSLVVTTDMLVEGCHFSDRTTPAIAVGWRSVSANLSDLAAMGASPLGITVALGLRGETPINWVEQLYEGMAECLDQFQTPIIGGDICRSPINTISITAIGTVAPQRIIKRSTAQPEWAIMVSGAHGHSRAGLELLLNENLGASLSETEKRSLQHHHQYPQPRLDILPSLQKLWDSDPHLIIAGMDSSDGLADAIVQISQTSGVGARIEAQKLPHSNSLFQLAPAETVLDWVLYGGEDFELVLCLPCDRAQQLIKHIPGSAIIGVTTTETETILLTGTHSNSEIILTQKQGFQHF
ncbi:thiamine-phosphate kinase [Arthrospira platensis BEA 1257B]